MNLLDKLTRTFAETDLENREKNPKFAKFNYDVCARLLAGSPTDSDIDLITYQFPRLVQDTMKSLLIDQAKKLHASNKKFDKQLDSFERGHP